MSFFQIRKLRVLDLSQWLFLLLLICLSGRFYYLLGFVGHLKPTSPIPLILMKDFFALIIHVIFFFIIYKDLKKGASRYRLMLPVVLFSMLLVGGIHFLHLSFLDFAQHHLRNYFFYLPFILYGTYFKKIFGERLFYKLLLSLSSISSFVSVIQIHLFSESLFDFRSLGVSGDPNANSFVILVGIGVLFLNLLKVERVLSFALLALHVYALDTTKSLSGIIAFVFGFIPVVIFVCRKYGIKYFFIRALMFLFLFVSIFYSSYKNDHRTSTLRKVELLLSWAEKSDSGIKGVKIVAGRIDELDVLNEFFERRHAPNGVSSNFSSFLAESFNSKRTDHLSFGYLKYLSFNLYEYSKKYLSILVGDLNIPRFVKGDNLYIVLFVNFGFVSLLFFISILLFNSFYVLSIFRKVTLNSSDKSSIFFFSLVIFFFVFGAAHGVSYKFPNNIIAYICMGWLYQDYFDKILGNKVKT